MEIIRLQYKNKHFIQIGFGQIKYVEKHNNIHFRYFGQYKNPKHFTVWSSDESIDIKIDNNMVSIDNQDYKKYIRVSIDDDHFSLIINKKCILISDLINY